jgi:4-hydroxybenzoate polyprenyltransferase
VLTLRAIARLIRLSSSLFSALAVFVAFLARTENFRLSLGYATPLLFIGMCTFIANDLEDLEKDQLIHPDRPLPARNLTPEFAAILYSFRSAWRCFQLDTSSRKTLPFGITA